MLEKKIEKIIEYGLYLFAFLLTLQTRWILKDGGNEYWTYSLYISDVLLILLIIFNFQFSIFKQFLNFKFSKVIYSIFLLDLACVVSIFFAIDKPLALYKLAWLLLGQGVLWLLLSAKYNKTKLLWCFLSGIFLQAGLGIYQFLTQSSFSLKWLGLALHDPMELGTSVIEAIAADNTGERWLRAYGGMDHPNILGGALAIVILLLVGNFLLNKFSKNSGVFSFQIAPYIFYFVFFLGLILTFSRSTWMALTVGMGFFLIIFLIRKDFAAQKQILILILSSGIIFFIFFNLFNSLFLARAYSSGRLEIKSNTERIAYLQEARDVIKKNYLTGVGLGNYAKFLERRNPDKALWEYQPVHNVFLLVWAEAGVVGFLGFLGLLGLLGWELFKRREIIGLGILLSLIVLMMFDHWLWTLHFGILFFWFAMGLVLEKRR